MPLPCAGTSSAERVQEGFYSFCPCARAESRCQVLQRSELQKWGGTETQAEQNETQKDTSSLEKLLVFFYPSQWNLKAGNTSMAHPESHPRAGNAWAEGGELWLTHPTGRFSLQALMQIPAFALGRVGLSPYDFWFPANSVTQHSHNQCALPGSRFYPVLICSHKLAHSNLGPQLFWKKKIFFITADPNQILMESSQVE